MALPVTKEQLNRFVEHKQKCKSPGEGTARKHFPCSRCSATGTPTYWLLEGTRGNLLCGSCFKKRYKELKAMQRAKQQAERKLENEYKIY